jgi:hypothetical protein
MAAQGSSLICYPKVPGSNPSSTQPSVGRCLHEGCPLGWPWMVFGRRLSQRGVGERKLEKAPTGSAKKQRGKDVLALREPVELSGQENSVL